MGRRLEEELEQPGQANLAEDCNMIALQCAAEGHPLSVGGRGDSYRDDGQRGKNGTTEDNATRRTLRSQQ
ncbi:unnamed protein product [Penicillium nalgiovense]|nr:unnamed protein product [Penicillium nalgiovense]